VAVLFLIRFVAGTASTGFDLAQCTFLSSEVPFEIRGRVSAMLSGTQKTALVGSALISGLVAQHVSTRSVFLVQASFSGLAMLSMLFAKFSRRPTDRPSPPVPEPATTGGGKSQNSLRSVFGDHWRDLLGAGFYCSTLIGIRYTWAMILPLKGLSIGLQNQEIGFVMAMFRAMDAFGTLAVAGYLFDKLGSRTPSIMANALIGLAFFLLPFATGFWTTCLVTVFYSMGNSLTGGLVNYYATTLAPPHARTEFLGLWETVTSIGECAMPPLFGLMADATGLNTASTITSGSVVKRQVPTGEGWKTWESFVCLDCGLLLHASLVRRGHTHDRLVGTDGQGCSGQRWRRGQALKERRGCWQPIRRSA